MNSKSIFLLPFSLFLCIIGLAGITYAQTKIQRNLKDYKQGKTLEDRDSHWGNAEESGALDHIHKYTWELWNKKEPAFFRVNSYTREGRQSVAMYYIEKRKDGLWQLTVEWDSINNCPYTSKQKCEETRYKTYIYRNLEKVTDKNGKSTIIFHSNR